MPRKPVKEPEPEGRKRERAGIAADLIEAKRALSMRLLRAGLHGGVVGMAPTLNVMAAASRAGANVHAVGIGRKIVEGKETKDLAVRIYVVQKLAPSLVPPRDLLPKEIDGITTDVIESPPAFIALPVETAARRRRKARRARRAPRAPRAPRPVAVLCTINRQRRQRPVVAGISAAHRFVTAGTIAYFCRSTKKGDNRDAVHVLSNNHVFADVNKGRPGDDLYQPGPADGGGPDDHFADLHRYVPIRLSGTQGNRVDAAIGRLLPRIQFRREVCTIGRITGVARATEGMRIRKHGRTTGYREGVVTDELYDALVGMDRADPSVVALFEDQMRLERVRPYPDIGLGGDSGSLVVMKDAPRAVGLYFAGPASGVYGVANHIEDVLRELEIELV